MFRSKGAKLLKKGFSGRAETDRLSREDPAVRRILVLTGVLLVTPVLTGTAVVPVTDGAPIVAPSSVQARGERV